MAGCEQLIGDNVEQNNNALFQSTIFTWTDSGHLKSSARIVSFQLNNNINFTVVFSKRSY
jgi:hypothetical protein